MTDDRIALRKLLKKGSDATFLREMIGFAAHRLVKQDAEGGRGAGHGERSTERLNQRHDYCQRDWQTRTGTVEFRSPKLQRGSYFPAFLEPRWLAENALTAVLREVYVQGISTGYVDDLVRAMGMKGISNSQVSRLCAEIDSRVQDIFGRPIEGDWPYLWLHATDVKVKEAGRLLETVPPTSSHHHRGRGEQRRPPRGPRHGGGCLLGRDVLEGIPAQPCPRGLRGVKLVIFHAHEGRKAAVANVLGATWQRCRVHFGRNAAARAGRTQRRIVSAWIGTAYAQEDAAAACA